MTSDYPMFSSYLGGLASQLEPSQICLALTGSNGLDVIMSAISLSLQYLCWCLLGTASAPATRDSLFYQSCWVLTQEIGQRYCAYSGTPITPHPV